MNLLMQGREKHMIIIEINAGFENIENRERK